MENIKKLCDIMDEVMEDLRFLRGLDNGKVDLFEKALIQVIDDWKNEEYIPKLLCNLFIDFYPAAEASADMYNVVQRQTILEFADKMTDLMRICVDVKGE